VLPAPTYVISDAHLGFAPADVERSMLAFVRHLRGTAAALVINGDLFEFWFEWRTVIPRPAFRVLAALADLREAGVPVLLIAGNHDCWGGEVLTRDVGLSYCLTAWTGTLAGWETRIEHGDGLRPREDRRYRAMRRVLRHPLAVAAFGVLHPDFASRLAMRTSDTSRHHGPRDGGAGLRASADRVLAADPSLELVIYGHSHVASIERLTHGVYANAGSWLTAPTFLRVTSDRIALGQWDGSAEGPDLDAIERAPEKSLPKP
jgi:UDP-2,3-diacylglucosamine hydrolase